MVVASQAGKGASKTRSSKLEGRAMSNAFRTFRVSSHRHSLNDFDCLESGAIQARRYVCASTHHPAIASMRQTRDHSYAGDSCRGPCCGFVSHGQGRPTLEERSRCGSCQRMGLFVQQCPHREPCRHTVHVHRWLGLAHWQVIRRRTCPGAGCRRTQRHVEPSSRAQLVGSKPVDVALEPSS